MPVKDIHHNAVKNALIKDSSTITADLYPIKYAEVKLFADMAGEKPCLQVEKINNWYNLI